MRTTHLAVAVVATIFSSMPFWSNRVEAMTSAARVRRAADRAESFGPVRCCQWGPHGWFDTWRHCHYCGWTRYRDWRWRYY